MKNTTHTLKVNNFVSFGLYHDRLLEFNPQFQPFQTKLPLPFHHMFTYGNNNNSNVGSTFMGYGAIQI